MPKKRTEEKKEVEKKSKDSVLIITEKPQAAMKIASALSDGQDKKYTDKGVSYYKFVKDGKEITVGCAVGHLFGLSQKEGTKEIPIFDIEWTPNYENKGAEFTKRYFDTLKILSKNASEFIVATDYDIEGEVIGLNVIRFISKQKDAKRMKFSSLTKEELLESYNNVSKTLNWGQAIAGETRHYLDWFYGINLSRALMEALKKAGRFRIMSIGRVQGPALAILVEKELQIKSFKAEPYWQVFLLIQDLNNQKLEVKYHKDLTKEKELLQFKQLKNKKAEAKTEIKNLDIPPPVPFDLTTLQTEAYKFFSLTPTQTLQVAQRLYLEGLISYPRTSSQKYPETIGYPKILKQLEKNFDLKYAVNKKPIEGKKIDPAHPAIYPTGESGKLDGDDKKIYDLIVKRFIACFCNAAKIEEKKVIVSINNLEFYAKGLQIKEKNWINVYKSDFKEEKIPTINGEVEVKEIRIEEKMTQPPKRFTAASLVRELEKRNLGTKATRASIVETLYDRDYVKEKSIEATPLGISLIKTLGKYSPIIIDEKLTRELEKEMETIQTASKELDKKQEKIIEKAKHSILEILKGFEKHEKSIGEALKEANTELIKEEIKENTLNKCPKCGKGNLRILFNRNSRRYFIACNQYPECKTTFSLPPNGLMKPAGEICEFCGFPLMLAIRKGRRPWKYCFNPECKTNESWAKKGYKKSSEKEEKVEDKEKKEIKVDEKEVKAEEKPKKIIKKKEAKSSPSS